MYNLDTVPCEEFSIIKSFCGDSVLESIFVPFNLKLVNKLIGNDILRYAVFIFFVLLLSKCLSDTLVRRIHGRQK